MADDKEALFAELQALSPEKRAELLKRVGKAATKVATAGASSSGEATLVRVARDRPLPLSFAQQRLWFLEQIDPQTSTYNVPEALRLRGPLDPRALEGALADLVERHEALRTTFWLERDEPVQHIAEPAPVPLELVDLRALAADEREPEMRRIVNEFAERPFDLRNGPMLRACLIALGDEDHVFELVVHHVATDGWSVGVAWRDLSAFYRARVRGEPALLPPLEIQYADYAVWQRQWMQGGRLAEQLSSWKEKLAGVPPLEVPGSRPRPAITSSRGAALVVPIAKDVVVTLEKVSRSQGATLFMAMLAAFAALIHRYSGQSDIAVGAPIAGRRVEVESLVGFFVNSLVMRCDLRGNPTVRELLARVRAVALHAFANQDLPFDALVEELHPERNLNRQALIQVMFVLQNTPQEAASIPVLENLRAERVVPELGSAKFDLTVSATPEADGSLNVRWEYRTDIFDAAFVARMAAHYGRLLESFARDLDARIASLPMLEESERTKLVRTWNETKTSHPRDVCLHQLFEQQVERTPDAIAVSFEGVKGKELTFRELDSRANQVAHYLRRAGVRLDDLVGIFSERSLELVVGLLGILKAGAAYVPLDPEYPRDRVKFMIEDAGISILLTQAHLRRTLPDLGAQRRVVALDEDWATIAREPTTSPGVKPPPDALSYVVFTSGSTGKPKAAMNTHGGICNRLAWQQETFRLTPSDRVLHKCAIGFDVSVWEIFWPLLTGARLVLSRMGTQVDLAHQLELVRDQGITLLHWMPTVIPLVVELPNFARSTKSLRQVITGAEAVTFETQERFFAATRAHLANCYGPSECTIDVMAWICERGGARGMVPIGRPLYNTQAYVVDRNLELVPVGVPGELCVGGFNIGRGYHRRPALTAEKFIPDPFSGVAGSRLYRTGDLVRQMPDGTTEFLGRIDHQVKLRGFRIELGEIEAALTEHPAVRSAVVIVRNDSGVQELVAYVVAASKPADATKELELASELKRLLGKTLPEHMVPTAIVFLSAMPLTSSGKVDRKVLPAPERGRAESAAYEAPSTPDEQLLADMWRELLGVARVGLGDDFFDLGGHSLLAMRLIARIRQKMGLDVSVRTLFEAPTLRAFAERVRTCAPAGPNTPIEPLPRADDAVFPLSYEQEIFWNYERANPGSTQWNAPAVFELRGPLDIDVLKRVIDTIVERHEPLRTCFPLVDGKPVQKIANRLDAMTVVDLRGHDARTRNAELTRLAQADVDHVFDLVSGPMFRTTLVRLADDDHVLLALGHHTIVGGDFQTRLQAEVASIYDAFSRGDRCPLPALPFQYADYAVWQRKQHAGPAFDKHRAFWKRKLEGASPTRIPNERDPSTRAMTPQTPYPMRVPAHVVSKLRALAQREDVTLFTILLSALQTQLHRTSRQEDMVVMSVSDRRQDTPDVADAMLANFTSLFAIRSDLSGGPTFRQLLGRVRGTLLEAVEHELLLPELFPDCSPLDHPLTKVVHNFFPASAAPSAEGSQLVVKAFAPKIVRRQARHAVIVFKVWEEGPELLGRILLPNAMFDAAAGAQFISDHEDLLASVSLDPDQKIAPG